MQGQLLYYLYSYTLKGLSSTRKQSITHALYGSGGRNSFLKKIKGYRIGRNNLIIPIETAIEADKFFDKWGLKPLKIKIAISRTDLEKISKYWKNA